MELQEGRRPLSARVVHLCKLVKGAPSGWMKKVFRPLCSLYLMPLSKTPSIQPHVMALVTPGSAGVEAAITDRVQEKYRALEIQRSRRKGFGLPQGIDLEFSGPYAAPWD